MRSIDTLQEELSQLKRHQERSQAEIWLRAWAILELEELLKSYPDYDLNSPLTESLAQEPESK